MNRGVSNDQDVLDSRDVIARIEQLQAIRQPGPVPEGVLEDEDYLTDQDSLFAELDALESFAKMGEDYCADWHFGETLIRETYFTEYAQELAEDIGAIDRDALWPACHIDWEAAADALRIDYTELDFGGVTYLAR